MALSADAKTSPDLTAAKNSTPSAQIGVRPGFLDNLSNFTDTSSMPRPPRLLAAGILYHVIVRGNHKQKTFLSPQDYEVYEKRLAQYRNKYHVNLYAFCLMPNHVHLLLDCPRQPLSKFMQGLQQSYTQYFNLAHKKVGHLFQGRYKAIICDRDEYLLTLVRYIHLNPVRARLVQSPAHYKFSSHNLYLAGKPTEMVNPSYILDLLGGRTAYKRFVLDGIREGHNNEYYSLLDQRFLGSEDFANQLNDNPSLQREQLMQRPLGLVLGELSKQIKINVNILQGPDRSWRVSRMRTILAFIMIRRLGFGVNEVAKLLRRDPTTLTSLVSRLSTQIQREPALMREVERLDKSFV